MHYHSVIYEDLLLRRICSAPAPVHGNRHIIKVRTSKEPRFYRIHSSGCGSVKNRAHVSEDVRGHGKDGRVHVIRFRAIRSLTRNLLSQVLIIYRNTRVISVVMNSFPINVLVLRSFSPSPLEQ